MPVDLWGGGEGMAMRIGRDRRVSGGGSKRVSEANLDAVGASGMDVKVRVDWGSTYGNMSVEEGVCSRGGTRRVRGVGRGEPETLTLKVREVEVQWWLGVTVRNNMWRGYGMCSTAF